MNRWLKFVLTTSCLLLGAGAGIAASLINDEASSTQSATQAPADDAQPFTLDELDASDLGDGASQNALPAPARQFQHSVLLAAAPWVSPCSGSSHQQPPARAPPSLSA